MDPTTRGYLIAMLLLLSGIFGATVGPLLLDGGGGRFSIALTVAFFAFAVAFAVANLHRIEL
mgnify:CR=1 FL=1